MQNLFQETRDNESIRYFIEKFNLSETDSNTLERFLVFLSNKVSFDEHIPYGLLIQTETKNEAVDFLNHLEICIKSLRLKKEYELVYATEKQVSKKTLSRYSWKHILAVIECEETGSIDSMMQAFKSTSEITRVVFASENVIRSRFMQNSEFYYRLLPRHIILRPLSAPNIYHRTISDLKNKYRITEGFEKELFYYIDTIYETAELKNQDFIEDLEMRILRQMDEQRGRSAYEKEYDVNEQFVPFSRKVLDRKAAESTIDASGVEKFQEDTTEKEPVKEYRPEEIWENSTKQDISYNTDCMNVVISNISSLSKILQKREYVDEDGNKFDGNMTNEPPIKSFIKRQYKKGYRVDRILYIESDLARKVVDVQEYGMLSPSDFLRYKINEYLINENYPRPDFNKEKDIIHIADEPDRANVSETVFAVMKRTQELYQECQKKGQALNVFIESNGGVRYVLTMLLSIMKTMESSLKDFHIKEITSMVLNQNPVKIINTKDIYETTQIMTIVSEYTNYGRIHSMENYINNIFAGCDDESLLSQKDEIVVKLSKLANDIQLCRTTMMLDDFYEEGGIGSVINNFLDAHKNSTDSSVRIFNYILSTIIEEYNDVIYKDYESSKDKVSFLPKVIKWCIEKDFLVQALTLCSEKLAEYLFATGKLQITNSDFKDYVDQVDKKDYEKHYHFLANLRSDYLSNLRPCESASILKRIKKKDKLGIPESSWEKLLVTIIPISEENEKKECAEYDNAAKNIIRLAREYTKVENNVVNDNYLNTLFDQCGYDISILEDKVKISKNFSATIMQMLEGKYENNEHTVVDYHINIDSKEKRLALLLPVLAQKEIERINKPVEELLINRFNIIIDSLFNEDEKLANNLKQKYSEKQCKKYYIGDALDVGWIGSSISKDRLQDILYLYSICKEQRNISNHAHISEKSEGTAMTHAQTNMLISALLNMLEE